MPRVALRPQAEADALEQTRHLAGEAPDTALRFIEEVAAAFDRLARHPRGAAIFVVVPAIVGAHLISDHVGKGSAIASSFGRVVAARLEKGRETYRDGSFSRAPVELAKEVEEELLDVCACSFIL